MKITLKEYIQAALNGITPSRYKKRRSYNWLHEKAATIPVYNKNNALDIRKRVKE